MALLRGDVSFHGSFNQNCQGWELTSASNSYLDLFFLFWGKKLNHMYTKEGCNSTLCGLFSFFMIFPALELSGWSFSSNIKCVIMCCPKPATSWWLQQHIVVVIVELSRCWIAVLSILVRDLLQGTSSKPLFLGSMLSLLVFWCVSFSPRSNETIYRPEPWATKGSESPMKRIANPLQSGIEMATCGLAFENIVVRGIQMAHQSTSNTRHIEKEWNILLISRIFWKKTIISNVIRHIFCFIKLTNTFLFLYLSVDF